MGKSKKVLTVVVLCFMLLLSKNFKEGRQTSDSGDSKETNTFKSVFLEKKELELYPPGRRGDGSRGGGSCHVWGCPCGFH